MCLIMTPLDVLQIVSQALSGGVEEWEGASQRYSVDARSWREAPASRSPSPSAKRPALRTLRRFDVSPFFKQNSDEPAEQRPGRASGPPGDNIGRVVHAEIHPAYSNEKAQQEGRAHPIDLYPAALHRSRKQHRHRQINDG